MPATNRVLCPIRTRGMEMQRPKHCELAIAENEGNSLRRVRIDEKATAPAVGY